MSTTKSAWTLAAAVAFGFGLLGSGVMWISGSHSAELAVPFLVSGLASAFVWRSMVYPLHQEIVQAQDSLKSMAENVQDTRRKERAVVDNAVDVICVIDIKGNFLQVNPASKTVWGYLPEEIVCKNLSEFLAKEDVNNTLQNVLGAEKSIERIYFENRFEKKSGEIIDLLWSAHWSASDGGLFCVVHDITQRKRAERLLKESEERIRSIFENLPAGVVVVNRVGFIEFINATGCALSGYSQEQIGELQAAAMFAFCSDPFTQKQLDESIERGQAEFESQVIKENGQRLPAHINLSRIVLEGEKCHLISFLDNSIKHEIEIAKREFVSMVSHDLRSPLTTILSSLQFLEDGLGGALTPSGASLAGKARRESERLIVLVKDLLDLEKMKAGKFNMHFASTNIKDVVLASLSAVSGSATARKVNISVKVNDDLVGFCDGARLIQVLVNLLDNAVKFSPPDEVVLVEANLEDEEITVCVSNKGRLIPTHKLKTIFDRFEQVDEADAKERKGTGLGLAICKIIVEQHCGTMWATSDTKEGTRFSFTIPTRELAQMKSIE